MVFPKPTETAILHVNGRKYQDWESVMVRHALRDVPPYHCRFTCSEGMPLSKNFAVMQIKPGDECSVTLAGFPAFFGKVETRQVYYDAHRHHIEIQCATNLEVATASVISKTMEWKDKTFQQIGQEILKKLGINMVFEGGAAPSYKFPRVSATPGESIGDFLDMLARSLSQESGIGISFTSNINGDFVVIMGPNGGPDAVVEGRNIIIGREVIYNASMAGKNPIIALGTGGDDKSGAEVSHSNFYSGDMEALGKTAPSVIVSELPTSDKNFLKGRVTSETHWQKEDRITVTVTVHGWIRPSGGLWYRDQHVLVTSPMLIMNNEDLIAKSVTFTQDNATGTRTTLELCNLLALGPLNPAIT